MKLRIIAALVATIFGQPGTAVAADIFVGGMRWTGIPAIWIRGQIVPGDERTFAVVAAKRRASVVYLSSEGGEVDAAIAIGRMVRKLGLDTFVGRGSTGCWSACTLIWLSGRHAIIQRDSYLGFHAANVPEGTAMMVEYLAELGLTPAQINYMIRAPQPDIQLAMEWHARALGFHWQEVPSLFGGWQSCESKYCLAKP
jgi:membrane-bound ClpP family serine protease